MQLWLAPRALRLRPLSLQGPLHKVKSMPIKSKRFVTSSENVTPFLLAGGVAGACEEVSLCSGHARLLGPVPEEVALVYPDLRKALILLSFSLVFFDFGA